MSLGLISLQLKKRHHGFAKHPCSKPALFADGRKKVASFSLLPVYDINERRHDSHSTAKVDGFACSRPQMLSFDPQAMSRNINFWPSLMANS